MITSIAQRELRSMFLSPLAWSVLAVTQLIIAWSFFTQMDFFFTVQPQLATMPNAPGVTDLVVMPTYEIASIILLMVTPLLTMRLISEEKRNGSLALLLSSPVSMTQIVLGKFFGIVAFMLILVGMISLMPLSLLMGAELDLGKLAAGQFPIIDIAAVGVTIKADVFGGALEAGLIGGIIKIGDDGSAYADHAIPVDDLRHEAGLDVHHHQQRVFCIQQHGCRSPYIKSNVASLPNRPSRG